MKVLVTGSSGHLGIALCKTFEERGIPYVSTDILAGDYTQYIGSIVNRSFVDRLFVDVDYVIHAATLHKPHVAIRTKQDFVDTNITGTLNLLEASVVNKVKGFLFTSTTSTFGDAMKPKPEGPAVWVTEELVPQAKNIYGATKCAAEDLCQLFARKHQLPCLVLKTSRFFWETDDNHELVASFYDLNIKANEYLNRRLDVEDAVSAHLLALEKVERIGFSKYILSATTPFRKQDLLMLAKDASQVVEQYYPSFSGIYQKLGWKMFPTLGRVYVNNKARAELGWRPVYDFKRILDLLEQGKSIKSPLAQSIQTKVYR